MTNDVTMSIVTKVIMVEKCDDSVELKWLKNKGVNQFGSIYFDIPSVLNRNLYLSKRNIENKCCTNAFFMGLLQ